MEGESGTCQPLLCNAHLIPRNDQSWYLISGWKQRSWVNETNTRLPGQKNRVKQRWLACFWTREAALVAAGACVVRRPLEHVDLVLGVARGPCRYAASRPLRGEGPPRVRPFGYLNQLVAVRPPPKQPVSQSTLYCPGTASAGREQTGSIPLGASGGTISPGRCGGSAWKE